MNSTLPPREQYNAAFKRLKSKPNYISRGIRYKDGAVETYKEKIIERWAEFHEQLYSDSPVATNIDDSHEDPT